MISKEELDKLMRAEFVKITGMQPDEYYITLTDQCTKEQFIQFHKAAQEHIFELQEEIDELHEIVEKLQHDS